MRCIVPCNFNLKKALRQTLFGSAFEFALPDVLNCGRKVQYQIINVLLSSVGAFNTKYKNEFTSKSFWLYFYQPSRHCLDGPRLFQTETLNSKAYVCKYSSFCHASSRPGLYLKVPRQINVEAFKVSAQFLSESPIVIEMI